VTSSSNVYKNYVFTLPTEVRYGAGVAETLAEALMGLSSDRVLVVTDPGVVQAGLLERIGKILDRGGVSWEPFTGVEPNPRDEDIMLGAGRLRDGNFNGVVGLGGGSSMDSAKAILAMTCNPGRVNDYEGFNRFSFRPELPLVCVPTTSGTGSEMDNWSVVTDTERNVKMGLGDPALTPSLALVDPLLTITLPPHLTAGTGMDALSHALEVYVSRAAQPVTDALAIHAIELVGQHLRRAVADGACLEARCGMAEASMIAGAAMANCDCGAVHAMAEAAGGKYDVPHGAAIAAYMPVVLEFNLIARPEKFARVAQALGMDLPPLASPMQRACAAYDAVRDLNRDIGMPTPSELGLKEEDIEDLAQMAMDNMSAPGNPREVSHQDFAALFRRALDYRS